MYRWYKHELPVVIQSLFESNNNIHSYNTRHANSPHMFAKRNSLLCKSFIMQAPKLWISLPADL